MANKVVIDTELNTKPIKDGVKEIEKEVDKINSADNGAVTKEQEEAIDAVIKKIKEREAEERRYAEEASKAASDREAELQRQIELRREAQNQSQQTPQPQAEQSTIKPEIPGNITEESTSITKLGDDATVTNQKIVDLVDRLKDLKYRKKELEDTGYSFGFKDYEDTIQEISVLEQELNKYKDTVLKNVKTASDKASKSIRKMGDSAKKTKSGFAIGLKSKLKYTFGIRSLFALINKLHSVMVEGFKNLAQFNDGVNPTNTALSNLKAALTQLKNSFAVAFAPILTVVEPVLTKLINMLSTAMNYVGQFFTAMTGASSYTKAIKVQEDYAKSLNGTAAAAKKAKGSLASIDELNNQSSQSDSSSGGSVSPNDMFEVAPIESKISGLADKLKSILNPIKESLQNWFKNINFQPLIDSLNRLKVAMEPLVGNIGKGLLWLFENVLEPLGSFVIEDALPAFFDVLASAVEMCNKAFAVIAPYLSKIWNEVFAPFDAFLGEIFVDALHDVADFFSDLGDMFVSKSQEIGTFFDFLKKALQLLTTKWKICIQFMSGMLKPFLNAVVNIIGHIIDTLSGLIKFITGVFTSDWKKAWEGIKEVFKGIWNIIVDIFEGVINMIIGGLNRISVDIPDFVSGIGGQHIGFNITPISLPRLATGTVVPRQSKEFAAILGDNNRETEVVSPLSTIKQALIEALQESGYYRQSDDRDIVINIDGREVFRAVKKQNDSYKKQHGKSAFQY